jgi:DNA-binding response OmpR family regulator
MRLSPSSFGRFIMKPVVLLAEADEAMAKMCQRFLNTSGYEVSVASTAAECLKKLRQQHPSFAIIDADEIPCDAEMPLEMELADLPIVLLGTKQPPDVSAEAFVEKPFRLAELAEAVDLADSLASIPG